MNKFEKQLEKWNGGILRGAQSKLAKRLRVSTATVALWATGKRRPSKGFVAQMAQLFGLDDYDVIRLFPANTTYPDLQPGRGARSLRDAQTPENTYSADNSPQQAAAFTNSVSLPLLTHAPEQYPAYNESDVAEWWTIPLRYAKGAKYLVQDGPNGKENLYFIRPETNLLEGALMLFKTPDGYTVKRARREKEHLVLYTEQDERAGIFLPQQLLPLGVAVCKMEDTQPDT